jgi:hypothetical protein
MRKYASSPRLEYSAAHWPLANTFGLVGAARKLPGDLQRFAVRRRGMKRPRVPRPAPPPGRSRGPAPKQPGRRPAARAGGAVLNVRQQRTGRADSDVSAFLHCRGKVIGQRHQVGGHSQPPSGGWSAGPAIPPSAGPRRHLLVPPGCAAVRHRGITFMSLEFSGFGGAWVR